MAVGLIWYASREKVRQLRRRFAEGPLEENDPDRQRGSLLRRMPTDHAWNLEAALRLACHLGGCARSEALEWLLAEGYTSLVAQAPALIPDDPWELDRMLRELCATLDAADVWLGKSLSTFFRGRQWERLGYASDGQYARERLHMSRSSAWERVQLARSTTRFDHIVDAIYEGAIGTCAARMLARIATPETEHAWVERAKVRTYKHLREEIELVSLDVRMHGDRADRSPPDDERIRRYHEWQREVLTGEAFRKSAETGEPVRMSARS